MSECECHEWYDVAEIGDWLHGLGGSRSNPIPVREVAATEPIWEPGRCELNRDELTARIIAAGHRIGCVHALKAMTYTDGRIGLSNGVHRWAVAVELGIARLPVDMRRESPEPAWEWEW